MENSLEDRLNDAEYTNWLKVSLALIQSKEALHDFTRDVFTQIHADIVAKVGSGSRCDLTCKTNKGKEPSCASCVQWVKEIKTYRNGQLNWKNTDPRIWHNTSWEIAKCFMNPQGSKTTAAQNTGPEKTDLSGILNVLVNCKEFGRHYLKDKKLPEKVREVRNKVMHCPTMSFPENVMKSHIDVIIQLLEDELRLKGLNICTEKVEMIKSLRDGELTISREKEHDCLEDVLRDHEVLLKYGDKEEHEMACDSFVAVSEWIKKNRDLELTFDSKLNSISDILSAKMHSVEVSVDDLKGQVEWLATKIDDLQLSHDVSQSTSSSAVGQHDKSLYKNSLQCYAQKKKLGIPKYSHEANEYGKFISIVHIAEKEFRSEEPKSTKKEADQSAAHVALKCFMNEGQHPVDMPQVSHLEKKSIVLPKITLENKVNYKNKLQEYAQKHNWDFPCYETKSENGCFVSQVFFGGVWYSPDVVPQSRKINAEQAAAQFTLAYLDQNSKEPAVGKASSSSSPGHKASLTSDPALPKCGNKTYKSILNEYAQRSSDDKQHVDYTFDDCDGNFCCSVTVMGKTYKSPSPMSNKKKAMESAAKEACHHLNLLDGLTTNHNECTPSLSAVSSSCYSKDKSSSIELPEPSAPDVTDSSERRTMKGKLSKHSQSLGSDKPENNKTESDSDFSTALLASGTTSSANCSSEETDIQTVLMNDSESKNPVSVNSPSRLSDPVDSEDSSKPFRSKLNEYVQSSGFKILPDYQDFNTEQGFLSKVTVMDKTYESSSPQKNKKDARENVAKMAFLDLTKNSASPESHLPPRGDPEVANTLDEMGQVSDQNKSSMQCDTDTLNQTVLPTACDQGLVDASNIQSMQGACKSDYKALLIELVKPSKVNPRYVTKQDPETKKFCSKVFLHKRCFKGEHVSRKKDAEQNAAKVALDVLKGQSPEPMSQCQDILKKYHLERLGKSDTFPKYDTPICTEEGRFTVVVSVVKEWKVNQSKPRPKKKDVEEALAECALKLLKEENKPIPETRNTNSRSKLNQFLQSQTSVPKLKSIVDGESNSFTGSLCFYTKEEYESLKPQLSADVAAASAALSACNDLSLI